MDNYCHLTSFLCSLFGSLIKSDFQSRLVWAKPYKSRIGPQQGESVFLKSQELYCIVYIQILSIKFISLLNWEVCPKVKLSSQNSLKWPYKSQIGPKQGENFIPKSREWYYIISMYKYKFTFFLSLIGKFDKKSNFQPRLA